MHQGVSGPAYLWRRCHDAGATPVQYTLCDRCLYVLFLRRQTFARTDQTRTWCAPEDAPHRDPGAVTASCLRELNHDLDVIRLALECAHELLRRLAPCDELRKPRAVRVAASTCPALYQCRLLALTLPTTTLFLSTAAAATSATAGPTVDPPVPTPVRHTTPPALIPPIASRMTCPAPVHSTITSGSKPTSAMVPVW